MMDDKIVNIVAPMIAGKTADKQTSIGLRRRDMMAGLAWPVVCVTGLSGFGASSAFAQARGKPEDVERGFNPMAWLNRGRDSFEIVYEASTGAVAARTRDFSIRAPDGNLCQARIAYPVTSYDRMPLVIFCPDAGCKGAMYDLLIGALAASGYFVIALDDPRAISLKAGDGTTLLSISQQVSRQSLAEARFLIDMAGEAAQVLGLRADRVDASRVGVVGHGEGAWMALSLAGWGPSNSNVSTARDGRVLAAFVLSPSPLEANVRIVNGFPDGGALALLAGQQGALPPALPGSGLIALKLPMRSGNFGGLIGNPGTTQRSGPRPATEPRPLAAAVAAASIFFDWGLKRQGDRKRTLLGLDGRFVEGLSQPLYLNRT
jgi:dienelactone hydrolase